jgi:hypothetical protein
MTRRKSSLDQDFRPTGGSMDACSHRRGERGQREGRAPLGRNGTALGRAVASKERCRVVSRRPFSERSRSLVREVGSSPLPRSAHSSEVVVLELEYDDYCGLAGLIQGECRAASDERRPVRAHRRVAGSLRRVADRSSACGFGTTLRRGPGPTPSREPETPPELPRWRPDGPRSDRSRARWSRRTSRGPEERRLGSRHSRSEVVGFCALCDRLVSAGFRRVNVRSPSRLPSSSGG